MEHRIFIAINLPNDIKNNLAEYQNKWPDLPARWTKPENLHITLVFIGHIDDQGISEIKQVLKSLIVRHKTFSVSLNKICYGPYSLRDAGRRARLGIAEHRAPRMIWVSGGLPKEFTNLKEDLEKELSGKIRLVPEKRETSLHITLARIKEWEWRRLEPDERPEVGESINFSFEVKSIELMESVLKKSGPEYTILESYFLNS